MYASFKTALSKMKGGLMEFCIIMENHSFPGLNIIQNRYVKGLQTELLVNKPIISKLNNPQHQIWGKKG